jgi:hypothetical protein
MLRLSSEISFYNGNSDTLKTRFTFVNEVEITSEWDSLTDKCKITIPRKIEYQDKNIAVGLNAVFNRGDKVIVKLGYDDNLVTRFTGYISQVELKLPLVIHCEDSMYLLKKKELKKKSYTAVGSKQLIKDIVGNTVKYKVVADQTLGQFIIQDGVTVSEVLEYLDKEHKIVSFFRDETLYVGLPYVDEISKSHIFDVNKNVVQNNLVYKKEEDYKVKIKAVSVNQEIVGGKSKEKKITVWYPSEQTIGSVRTYHGKMNIDSKSLEKEAKDFYNQLVFDGYTGDLLVFGAPSVNHGDSVTVKNGEIPEQDDDSYLIKSVVTTFGMGGYRQKLEFGGKSGVNNK